MVEPGGRKVDGSFFASAIIAGTQRKTTGAGKFLARGVAPSAGRRCRAGRDLRRALDGLLAGQPIDPVQRPSMGCNIKWRPGNAPEYFSGG
jgi:hypothetical protein